MKSSIFLLALVAGVVSDKTFYPEISITGESGLRLGLVGKFSPLFVVNAIHTHFHLNHATCGKKYKQMWNPLGFCDYYPMGSLKT